jgi:CheY-like chemotaxis protein
MLILIVEDEEVHRQAIERALIAAGHKVCWSSTGKGALALLRSEHPDLMILDMGLPDISGWEVAAEKLRDPTIAEIPVVVVSGYTAENIRKHSEVNPMSAIRVIIPKPIDLRFLVKAIGHIGTLSDHMDSNLDKDE